MWKIEHQRAKKGGGGLLEAAVGNLQIEKLDQQLSFAILLFFLSTVLVVNRS